GRGDGRRHVRPLAAGDLPGGRGPGRRARPPAPGTGLPDGAGDVGRVGGAASASPGLGHGFPRSVRLGRQPENQRRVVRPYLWNSRLKASSRTVRFSSLSVAQSYTEPPTAPVRRRVATKARRSVGVTSSPTPPMPCTGASGASRSTRSRWTESLW